MVEVVLCSGYPTQLAIGALLASLGLAPSPGTLTPGFVFALSAIDTVLLLALVFYFLYRSGESARALFLGNRPPRAEIGFGLATLPLVFLLVIAVQIVIRLAAPSLHNVEVNPFVEMLASPLMAAAFIALVLVAGGIREELQRAFLLHRFEQRLGGGRLGLVLTSVAFGLGHGIQGWDASILTGLLGAFWGVIYLQRRSVVSTVTSHAVFNAAQVILGYAALSAA
jgi:membrane protease YdiL (CAAX protease family)